MGTINSVDMELTPGEFQDVITSNTGKLVVVDFFAEWCMPCLMIAPVIEELSHEMTDAQFVKINVDENQALAQKFQVRSIPTLVVFKEGKEISRITGMQSREVLQEQLEALV